MPSLYEKKDTIMEHLFFSLQVHFLSVSWRKYFQATSIANWCFLLSLSSPAFRL